LTRTSLKRLPREEGNNGSMCHDWASRHGQSACTFPFCAAGFPFTKSLCNWPFERNITFYKTLTLATDEGTQVLGYGSSKIHYYDDHELDQADASSPSRATELAASSSDLQTHPHSNWDCNTSALRRLMRRLCAHACIMEPPRRPRLIQHGGLDLTSQGRAGSIHSFSN
jgi:hypothetical protein